MSQFNLVFTTYLDADIEDAVNWYESKQDGLTERFLEDYYASLDILTVNPLVFQVWAGKYRKLNLSRFSYQVFYRIDNDDVVLVGVFHSAQDPEKTWLKLKQRL